MLVWVSASEKSCYSTFCRWRITGLPHLLWSALLVCFKIVDLLIIICGFDLCGFIFIFRGNIVTVAVVLFCSGIWDIVLAMQL